MLSSPTRYLESYPENSSFIFLMQCQQQLCDLPFSEMLRTWDRFKRVMFGSDQETRAKISSDSPKGHHGTNTDTDNVARCSNSPGSRSLELELCGHLRENGISPTPFRKADLTMWTQNLCIISEP